MAGKDKERLPKNPQIHAEVIQAIAEGRNRFSPHVIPGILIVTTMEVGS